MNGAEPASALVRNVTKNLQRWIAAIALPPPLRMLQPHVPAMATTVAALAAVIASMFLFDAVATAWARQMPQWFRDIFETITDFGLSGWFLFPFGFIILCLAALCSSALPHFTQGVLTALAARFGFLFLAIGVPGLFVTIVKRLIGRARPYVGGHDDPFAYMPFIWRPEYAAMPSGHSTTAVAAAVAIGAIWPRTRAPMWFYAVAIMVSRVVVLAHHSSDVIAGALVGAVGALVMRRWFAARRLVFSPCDLRAFPGPSPGRARAAVGEAIAAIRSNILDRNAFPAD